MMRNASLFVNVSSVSCCSKNIGDLACLPCFGTLLIDPACLPFLPMIPLLALLLKEMDEIS
jgi:hypothetical protein